MWGFLFVFLDFHLQHINILPDFVGYILCIIGLFQLLHLGRPMRHALILSVILLLLSLPKAFGLWYFSISTSTLRPLAGNLPAGAIALPFLFFLLTMALQIALIFSIFAGIRTRSWELRNDDMPLLVDSRWRLFLISMGLNLITMLVALIFTPLALVLVIVAFVVGITITILLMNLMYKCANQL